MTIMFEAFEGDPQIVRFYGKGALTPADGESIIA